MAVYLDISSGSSGETGSVEGGGSGAGDCPKVTAHLQTPYPQHLPRLLSSTFCKKEKKNNEWLTSKPVSLNGSSRSKMMYLCNKYCYCMFVVLRLIFSFGCIHVY